MSFLPQPSSCCDQNCSTGSDSTTSTTVISQMYVGSFDDPNGNLTPDDTTLAAEYYKDENIPTIWRWSVTDQMWYATITP